MSEPADSVLVGRRVVVTRPVHQQAELVDALRGEGAEPVSLPLIDIVEIPAGIAELRTFLADAENLAWLVVTSPNGARVVSLLHEEGCVLPPVAALGPATAEAIGHSVEFVSSRAVASALVDEFPDGAGSVVVVQGDLADLTLSTGLTAKGWTVHRCDVYRTVDTDPTDDQLSDAFDADAVVLASGSAARNWARLTGDGFDGEVVVIGPVTAAAAHDAGLHVSAVADSPTAQGLIEALASALTP